MFKYFFIILFLIILGSCGPTYVEKDEIGEKSSPQKVVYKVYDSYNSSPPQCLAILPLSAGPKLKKKKKLDYKLEIVRKSLYAHLAPQGKKDVELKRVDFIFNQLSEEEKNNFTTIGQKLNCDAVMSGEVTHLGKGFFGVYSQIGVGADLKMYKTSDQTILWEGKHIAKSHGGRIPLSPVGLAVGILSAASHLIEENVLRVIDDLARRITETIPDNTIAFVDEDLENIIQFTPVLEKKEEIKEENILDFIQSLNDLNNDEKTSKLKTAINENKFNDQTILYKEIIKINPNDKEIILNFANYLIEIGDYTYAIANLDNYLQIDKDDPAIYFLKARVYIKMENLKLAEKSIILAAAKSDKNPKYLNSLGYVNSKLGNIDKAIAAYTMTLKKDSKNSYALYNLGVIHFNLNENEKAVSFFYKSGLSYLKEKRYDKVGKTINDLNELVNLGVNANQELNDLTNKLQDVVKENV